MRGVVCSRYGGPDVLEFGQLAAPEMRPDQIRVRVRAAGINFPDTLIIRGQYQLKPDLPFVPGFEVAGEVIAIGAEATGFALYDRVMGLTACGFGAFAEEAVLTAREAVLIAKGRSFVEAAGFYVAFGTAFHGLIQRGALQAGETLVVLGATGGVGLAAVELGAAMGARVIAVGRSLEKLEAARARGAQTLISYEDDDLCGRIKTLTDGRGADVCMDTLGGAAFDQMSRAINWGGRLLVVGFTSGVIPRLSVNLALLKGYAVIGVYWGAFVNRNPEANAANFRVIASMIAEGSLSPSVSRVYRMDQAASALQDLLSRNTSGKLVLECVAE